MMTCPSKVIALYGCIEWGLRDVKFLSPSSFTCNQGTFRCHAVDHEDARIFIHWREDQMGDEYDVYIIKNKKGDNCVLFKSQDLEDMSNKWVSFEWIAKNLKKKWRIDIQSTT